MKNSFQLAILTLTFAAAAAVDIFYERVRQADRGATFEAPPIAELFWIRVVGTLLVAGLLIWFVWQVQGKTANLLIASLTFFSGIIPLVTFTFWGFFAAGRLLAQLRPSWLLQLTTAPTSLTSHVAAFAVCVGTIQLVQLFRSRFR